MHCCFKRDLWHNPVSYNLVYMVVCLHWNYAHSTSIFYDLFRWFVSPLLLLFYFLAEKTKPIFFMSLERRTKRVSTATGFCKKKKVHITCIDLVYDIFLKRQEIKNLCKVFLWTCQNHGSLPSNIYKNFVKSFYSLLNDYLNRFHGIFYF